MSGKGLWSYVMSFHISCRTTCEALVSLLSKRALYLSFFVCALVFCHDNGDDDAGPQRELSPRRSIICRGEDIKKQRRYAIVR